MRPSEPEATCGSPTSLDVPQGDIFHDYVETIFRKGITAGYGNGTYGRDDPVTRAQMAVFLLRARHGSSYVPPTCAGVFSDVSCPGSSPTGSSSSRPKASRRAAEADSTALTAP